MNNVKEFITNTLGYGSAVFWGDEYQQGTSESWLAWYKGHVADFHEYKLNRGEDISPIQCQRATLNMAKKGCEAWADLLWNGDCIIALEGNISDDEHQAFTEALTNVQFTKQTIRLIEQAFALGTGAYSVYFEVAENGEHSPKVDYMPAQYVVPLTWDNNGDVTACAFPSYTYDKINERLNVYVRVCRKDGGYWLTENIYGEAKGKDGKIWEVAAPMDDAGNPLITEQYTTVYKPFELIRPNIANNIAPDAAHGISVYANAIDTLKSIDLAYDGMATSMRLGRPRLAISKDYMYFDTRYNLPVFDPVDAGLYALNGPQGNSDDGIIKDITANYVADKFERSLMEQLNIYGQQIGLGDKAFRYDIAQVTKTATEVISNNSAMLRTMEKHQEALRVAIETASWAICEQLAIEPNSIDITFDDSVTRDREGERQRWIGFVDRGWISPATYLERFEGLSEDEAKSIVLPAETDPADLEV